MIMRRRVLSVTAIIVLFGLTSAVEVSAQSIDESCFLGALANADDSTTVGELRALCLERPSDQASAPAAKQGTVYEQSAIDIRLAYEETGEDRPFVITAHQPNYLLASTWSDPNLGPILPIDPTVELKDNEMVFQLSIKAPIWHNMFGSDIDGYFGYTTKSYWQLFNDDFSAPFRETNYQPELFVRKVNKLDSSFGVAAWDLGFNHESNGRGEVLSRSWNRIMGRLGLQVSKNLTLAARAWYRIPEDEEDDGNPNMYKYYGYGDVRAIWTPNRSTFTALARPGTEEFSYELTWSYPISRVFRVYALYYNGYGESLLDYNFKSERFGIGIALNDFLIRE